MTQAFNNAMLEVKGQEPCLESLFFIQEKGSVSEAWKTCDNIYWMNWYLLDFAGRNYAQTADDYYTYLKPTRNIIHEIVYKGKAQLLIYLLREIHPELPEPSSYSAQELAVLFNEIIAEVLPLIEGE